MPRRAWDPTGSEVGLSRKGVSPGGSGGIASSQQSIEPTILLDETHLA